MRVCSFENVYCAVSIINVLTTIFSGNIASLVVETVFKEKFGLSKETDDQYANTKGWIVAIATAGAFFGCLACISLADKIGRRLALQLFTLVYIAGVLGQTFSNGNLSGLYASRFIAGGGIGVTTVLPPIYLSEVSSNDPFYKRHSLTVYQTRLHPAPFEAL